MDLYNLALLPESSPPQSRDLSNNREALSGIPDWAIEYLPDHLKQSHASLREYTFDLLQKLQEALEYAIQCSANFQPGSSFYPPHLAGKISKFAKHISLSFPMRITLTQKDGRKLIDPLYKFITLHANFDSHERPKAFKACSQLLITLLDEERKIYYRRETYKSFQAENLVPPADTSSVLPDLLLDWKPIYKLFRHCVNMDHLDMISLSEKSATQLRRRLVMELAKACRHFFASDAETIKDMFELLFPVIHPTDASQIDFSKDLSKAKLDLEKTPSIVTPKEYLTNVRGALDAHILGLFLPINVSSPQSLDYNQVVQQIMRIWQNALAHPIWDICWISILGFIAAHRPEVVWNEDDLQFILASQLKRLNLATAGSSIAAPANHINLPNHSLIGNLSDHLNNGFGSILIAAFAQKSENSSPPDSAYSLDVASARTFSHFMRQIETYLHPNNDGKWAAPLEKILSDIMDGLVGCVGLEHLVESIKAFNEEHHVDTKHPLSLNIDELSKYIPFTRNQSLKHSILSENVWKILIPLVDSVRILISAEKIDLCKKMASVVIRKDYSYACSSVLPRMIYGFQNPALGGRPQIMNCILSLDSLLSQLVEIPNAPNLIAGILPYILDHIDSADINKTKEAFDVSYSLLKAASTHKQPQRNAPSDPHADVLCDTPDMIRRIKAFKVPDRLKGSLIHKWFEVVKSHYTHDNRLQRKLFPLLSTDEQEQLNSEMTSLHAVIKDWSFSLWDKMLEFIKTNPKDSNQFHICILAFEMLNLADSEDLIVLLFEKFSAWLVENLSGLVDENCAVDIAMAFLRFIPTKVFKVTLSTWVPLEAGSSKHSQIESEVELIRNKLLLLAHIAASKPNLFINYKNDFLARINQYLTHSEKKVRIAARNALAVILVRTTQLKIPNSSLLPLESIKDLEPYSSSGYTPSFIDILLERSTWHSPNSEVIQGVAEIVDLYRKQSMDAISTYINTHKNDSAAIVGKSSNLEQLQDNIELLSTVLISVAGLLPVTLLEDRQKEVKSADGDEGEEDVDSGYDKTNAPKNLDYPKLPEQLPVCMRSQNLPQSLRELRGNIARMAKEFIGTFITAEKISDIMISVYSFVLLWTSIGGVNSHVPEILEVNNRYNPAEGVAQAALRLQKTMQQHLKEFKAVNTQVEHFLSPTLRARYWHRSVAGNSVLRSRIAETNSNFPFSKFAADCIRDFITHAAKHTEVLFGYGLTTSISTFVPHMKGGVKDLVPFVLQQLPLKFDANHSRHSFLMYVTLLQHQPIVTRMTTSWSAIKNFYSVIRQLPIHDMQETQQLITILFANVVLFIPNLAVTHLDRKECAAYVGLMDLLYQDIQTPSPPTHWRYQVFTLSLLFIALRKNIFAGELNPKLKELVASLKDRKESMDGLNACSIIKAVVPLTQNSLPLIQMLSLAIVGRLNVWIFQDRATDSPLTSKNSQLPDISQYYSERSTEANLDALITRFSNNSSGTTALDHVIRAIVGSVPGESSRHIWSLSPPTLRFHAEFWYAWCLAANSGQGKASVVQSAVNVLLNGFDRIEKDEQIRAITISTPSPPDDSPTPPSIPPVTIKSDQSKEQSTGTTQNDEIFRRLSELLTGFTRSNPSEAINQVWIPYLKTAPRLSTSRLLLLFDALNYCMTYGVDISQLEEFLVQPILESQDSFSKLVESNPFDASNRLRLLYCYYKQNGNRHVDKLASIGESLFVRNQIASSSHPQVRASANFLLALLSHHATLKLPFMESERQQRLNGVYLSIINPMIELFTRDDGPASSPTTIASPPSPASPSVSITTQDKESSNSSVPVTVDQRIKNSFLQWIDKSLECKQALLEHETTGPAILQACVNATVDSSNAVNKPAHLVLTQLALILVHPSCLPKILSTLTTLGKHPRWKARYSTLNFVRFFCFNHALLMDPSNRESLTLWASNMLYDSTPDVTTIASTTLTSLIRSLIPSDEFIEKMRVKFVSEAKSDIQKKKSPKKVAEKTSSLLSSEDSATTSSSNNGNNNELIQPTSGFASLAASAPYSIPPWLPKTMVSIRSLASHSNGTISQVATNAMTLFWKTHRDQWEFYKTSFTVEEQRMLEEKPVPTYYA